MLQDGREVVVGVAAVRARLQQLNSLARNAPAPSSPHPATEAVADNAVLQLTVPLTALQVSDMIQTCIYSGRNKTFLSQGGGAIECVSDL